MSVDRTSGYLAPPLNFFGIWGRCPECRRWRVLPYVKHFVGLKRPRWGVCRDCGTDVSSG